MTETQRGFRVYNEHMTIANLISKHTITLSPVVWQLCDDGLSRMTQTLDVSHDLTHIERIFDDLSAFLTEEKSIQKQAIDFSILLLAICWHDTWKATRFPRTLQTMLFDQYWDGWGSTRLFNQAARQAGLDERLRRSVSWLIREHGQLHWHLPKTVESRIFYDLDSLDAWSLTRIDLLKAKYGAGTVNPTLLRMAKFYFDNFMTRETESNYHFSWTKAQFRARKKLFMKAVDQLTAEYGHLIV